MLFDWTRLNTTTKKVPAPRRRSERIDNWYYVNIYNRYFRYLCFIPKFNSSYYTPSWDFCRGARKGPAWTWWVRHDTLLKDVITSLWAFLRVTTGKLARCPTTNPPFTSTLHHRFIIHHQSKHLHIRFHSTYYHYSFLFLCTHSFTFKKEKSVHAEAT